VRKKQRCEVEEGMAFFVELVQAVFGNPIFGGTMTLVSLFLGWYFNTKRIEQQREMGMVIASLQEENARLRDELKKEEDQVPTDPSRAKAVVTLRSRMQLEDVPPRVGSTDIPAYLIAFTLHTVGVVTVFLNTEMSSRGVGPLRFLAIVGGFALAVLFGRLLARRFRNKAYLAKFGRIGRSFLDAKLSLKEIDELTRWTQNYPWTYFRREVLLRSIQAWAHQASQEWNELPKEPTPVASAPSTAAA
jgi:hypothetical protein